MRSPALFLDRDGVLNELVYYASTSEWESPRCAADLDLIPGTSEALLAAQRAGWRLFIVSNQPSFAKGKTSRENLAEVHEALMKELGEVVFDAVYYCFHHPAAVVRTHRVVCDCRKPGARFLFDAQREHGVDLARSWMVGDADSDVMCGRVAGCRTALLQYPHSAERRSAAAADLTCTGLLDFVQRIGSDDTQSGD